MRESLIDTWSNRAAQWAQVVMLGLVAFGYFYTVRPVYQKDLLEEEFAHLSLESKALESRNAAAIAQASRLRSDLTRLQVAREALRRENLALSHESSGLRVETGVLQQRAETLDRRLTTASALNRAQLNQLAIGQRALLAEAVNFSAPVRAAFGTALRRGLTSDKASEVEAWEATKMAQPYEALVAEIDHQLATKAYFGLPAPHDVSFVVISELRRDLLAHSTDLSCPPINRSRWVAALRDARARVGKEVGACAEFEMDKRSKEDHWTAAQMAAYKRMPFWRTQLDIYKGTCELMGQYHVERRFDAAWQSYERPCASRYFHAVSIARGEEKPADAFRSVEPPAIAADWYRDGFGDPSEERSKSE